MDDIMLGLTYSDALIGDNINLEIIVKNFIKDYKKLKYSGRKHDLIEGTLWRFIEKPEANLDLWFVFISRVIDVLIKKRKFRFKTKSQELFEAITISVTRMRFTKKI